MENDSKRTPVPLDQFDLRILAELQRNGRITVTELAERVSLSPTPCGRRMRRLQEAGIVRAVVAVLNPASVGLNVTALVQVSLDSPLPGRLELFEEQVRQCPEIIECLRTTDQSASYWLKVIAPDLESLHEFLVNNIHGIEGVTDIHTSIVTAKITHRTELPLPQANDE